MRSEIGLVLGGALALSCGGSAGDDSTGGSADEGLTVTTATMSSDDETEASASDDSASDDDGPLLDQMAGTSGDGDGDCAAVSEEGENQFAPVDVMFVVDNSGSMDFEEASVQNSMNTFSNLITSLNIDVQVMLVSNYNICILPPLGAVGGCPGNDNNPPLYTHIDQGIGSNDALEVITENQGVIDQFDLLMRENSIKHIVVVSDDDSDKSATDFNIDFLALGTKYQGYKFHAIVASALPVFEPCVLISAAKGQEYIDLVALTGGVFGDLCLQEFGPVFVDIATAVQQTTPLACEWDIPPAPKNQEFDPEEVNVKLTLDGVEEDVFFVQSAADCGTGDGWFYLPDNTDPTTIRVCPATCDRVQSAVDAKVDILFGCETIPVG